MMERLFEVIPARGICLASAPVAAVIGVVEGDPKGIVAAAMFVFFARVLKRIDSLGIRLDSIESRVKALEGE